MHYALHAPQFANAIGWALRDALPLWAVKGLTWGTLALEAAIPTLILLAPAFRPLRGAAALMMVVFHAAIVAMLDVYEISLLMIGPGSSCCRAAPGTRRLGMARRAPRAAPAAPGRPGRLGLAWALLLAPLMLWYAWRQSPLVPEAWKPPTPRPVEALAAVLIFDFQGWRLFGDLGPDSVKGRTLVVSAVTADGRTVDPLNQAASNRAVPMERFTRRVLYRSLWRGYVQRISLERGYHDALERWILRYPERTRSPDDRIVAFQAYILIERMPMPGEPPPTGARRYVFLEWDARHAAGAP